METSEDISHPSLRRVYRSEESPSVDSPQLLHTLRPRFAHAVARMIAIVSNLVWSGTGDLSSTGFARVISHIMILSVVVGVIVVSTSPSDSNNARSARGSSVVLRAGLAGDTEVDSYYDLHAGGALFAQQSDIVRKADPYTVIPDRPRRGVIEYEVQPGDVLFSIANRFGITPESILWNNEDVLDNDPHQILPGTLLQIPPISGVIHTIAEGESLETIADTYKVEVEAITVTAAHWNNLLEGRLPPVGSTLIVPGGRREFKGWGLPQYSRADNSSNIGRPALGSCGNVNGSLVGSGSFIWPANNHWVSGYNYSAWHPGIDVAGRLGDPVYAADSGFVVYAGWSSVGYGNLVVVDHGNGWQTWYAHLNLILVTCGQSVWQGGTIGAIGSTGRSSVPHLHYEMRYQGTIPNPWNNLPPS